MKKLILFLSDSIHFYYLKKLRQIRYSVPQVLLHKLWIHSFSKWRPPLPVCPSPALYTGLWWALCVDPYRPPYTFSDWSPRPVIQCRTNRCHLHHIKKIYLSFMYLLVFTEIFWNTEYESRRTICSFFFFIFLKINIDI